MRQRLFGEDAHEVISGQNNTALCLMELGRPAEALPRYERAREIHQRTVGREDLNLSAILSNIACCHRDLGHLHAALERHEASLAMTERIHQGRDHTATAHGADLAAAAKAMGIASAVTVATIDDLRRAAESAGVESGPHVIIAKVGENAPGAKPTLDYVGIKRRFMAAAGSAEPPKVGKSA